MEIPELTDLMKYGGTREQATLEAEALAPRVPAKRNEHGESPLKPIHIT